MATTTVYMKAGDSDDLIVQLFDARGVKLPLSPGTTCVFKMRVTSTGVVTIPAGAVAVDPTGKLTYVWQPGETAENSYEGLFVITPTSGKKVTVPKYGFLNILIGPTF